MGAHRLAACTLTRVPHTRNPTRARDIHTQAAKIRGYLLSVTEELHDVPLYYNLHDVCKTVCRVSTQGTL